MQVDSSCSNHYHRNHHANDKRGCHDVGCYNVKEKKITESRREKKRVNNVSELRAESQFMKKIKRNKNKSGRG